MKIVEKTCPDFIGALASKEPVPGGGGAAALCGAIGTALGNMVGSLTVGKKKYAEAEPEILRMQSECDDLQAELLKLIDEDARVFAPLSKAYGLPSATEEEQKIKSETLETCSKEACMVPFAIMEKCCRAIELAERFARIGSRLAVSDAGCGAVLLKGALQAASLNIFINTKSLKDRAFAEDMNNRANKMLDIYGKRADAVFREVKDILTV